MPLLDGVRVFYTPVPAPVGLVLRQIGADVADLNVIGRDGDIEISRVLKIIAGSVGRPVVSQYWRPMATSASKLGPDGAAL